MPDPLARFNPTRNPIIPLFAQVKEWRGTFRVEGVIQFGSIPTPPKPSSDPPDQEQECEDGRSDRRPICGRREARGFTNPSAHVTTVALSTNRAT